MTYETAYQKADTLTKAQLQHYLREMNGKISGEGPHRLKKLRPRKWVPHPPKGRELKMWQRYRAAFVEQLERRFGVYEDIH